MTLTQLNYIITIAETKSMNKAAEKLYVSQPSLTNAIKELEKELGITIFYRSGRGVTLGRSFYCMPSRYTDNMKLSLKNMVKVDLIRRNSVYQHNIIHLQ